MRNISSLFCPLMLREGWEGGKEIIGGSRGVFNFFFFPEILILHIPILLGSLISELFLFSLYYLSFPCPYF